MAELPPAPRGIPIEDIPALFASLPRLTPAEAEAFGRDIDAARPGAGDEAQITELRSAVDEVLDELHELRLAIDAHFDHDVDKYFAHIREFEERLLAAGWVEARLLSSRQDRSADLLEEADER